MTRAGLCAALLTVGGLVAGGTVVAPASADAAVVICQRKNKVRLRQDTCKAKETQVAASELGVVGPQGDTGPTGDAGQDGAPGLSGLEVVTAEGNVIITFSGVSSATASCLEGKSVIGGGVGMGALFGSVSSQAVRESRPVTSDPQGWFGALEANVSDDWGARVWAICATVAP